MESSAEMIPIEVLLSVDGSGSGVTMRIKPTSNMAKLFRLFADWKRLDVATLDFFIGDPPRRVNPGETPNSLRLAPGARVIAAQWKPFEPEHVQHSDIAFVVDNRVFRMHKYPLLRTNSPLIESLVELYDGDSPVPLDVPGGARVFDVVSRLCHADAPDTLARKLLTPYNIVNVRIAATFLQMDKLVSLCESVLTEHVFPRQSSTLQILQQALVTDAAALAENNLVKRSMVATALTTHWRKLHADDPVLDLPPEAFAGAVAAAVTVREPARYLSHALMLYLNRHVRGGGGGGGGGGGDAGDGRSAGRGLVEQALSEQSTPTAKLPDLVLALSPVMYLVDPSKVGLTQGIQLLSAMQHLPEVQRGAVAWASAGFLDPSRRRGKGEGKHGDGHGHGGGGDGDARGVDDGKCEGGAGGHSDGPHLQRAQPRASTAAVPSPTAVAAPAVTPAGGPGSRPDAAAAGAGAGASSDGSASAAADSSGGDGAADAAAGVAVPAELVQVAVFAVADKFERLDRVPSLGWIRAVMMGLIVRQSSAPLAMKRATLSTYLHQRADLVAPDVPLTLTPSLRAVLAQPPLPLTSQELLLVLRAAGPMVEETTASSLAFLSVAAEDGTHADDVASNPALLRAVAGSADDDSPFDGQDLVGSDLTSAYFNAVLHAAVSVVVSEGLDMDAREELMGTLVDERLLLFEYMAPSLLHRVVTLSAIPTYLVYDGMRRQAELLQRQVAAAVTAARLARRQQLPVCSSSHVPIGARVAVRVSGGNFVSGVVKAFMARDRLHCVDLGRGSSRWFDLRKVPYKVVAVPDSEDDDDDDDGCSGDVDDSAVCTDDSHTDERGRLPVMGAGGDVSAGAGSAPLDVSEWSSGDDTESDTTDDPDYTPGELAMMGATPSRAE